MLREGRRLTQKQLAGEMRVHDSTICRWESSEVTIPDFMKIRLAQFFGCPVAWLMGWDDGDDADSTERCG